ncbi:MAG: hypothetical protein E6J01_15785 [Chloroflexi bacterium]|nr:MAG: hypothetical protein E6J01_15785 [Chloroflexota bacterium]
MGASITNKLLATVMAIALSGALTARASQDLHLTAPTVNTSSLPAALNQVAATATTALDPAGSIRQAYQQDHDALEHLRQQGSGLGSPAHQQFNQLIGADQAQLLAIEKAALDKIAAGSPVNATATIAQMAAIVTQGQASLTQFQAGAAKANGPGAAKSNGNGQKP